MMPVCSKRRNAAAPDKMPQMTKAAANATIYKMARMPVGNSEFGAMIAIFISLIEAR